MNNDLRKLQLIELQILDEFVRICDKYNLTYYLSYGTLLGAVRHKGFIPWDDDLDVVMPTIDYDKFIKIARSEIDKENFYLHDFSDANNPYPVLRIRKKRTIYSDRKSMRYKMSHYGIWMDIFRLDNVDDPKSYLYKFQSIYKSFISHVIFHRAFIDLNGLSFVRKFVHYCSCILSLESWNKQREKILRACKNNNSPYVCVFSTPYSAKKELMPRSAFGIPKLIEFEGKLYKAPADSDYILKKIYGDYMKLPPIDKQKNSHLPDIWEV